METNSEKSHLHEGDREKNEKKSKKIFCEIVEKISVILCTTHKKHRRFARAKNNSENTNGNFYLPSLKGSEMGNIFR
jgi:hypothetical protein